MFFDLASTPEKVKGSLLAFNLTKPIEAPAPVDDFTLVRTERPYHRMTDRELYEAAGGVMIYDVEIYVNYAMFSFKLAGTDKVYIFEKREAEPLDTMKLLWVMSSFLLVGFNLRTFDIPVTQLALQDYTCKALKDAANWIINSSGRVGDIEKNFGLNGHIFNIIDLIQVAPLQGSLKLYAGRLHCKRMQDLPFEHDAWLEPEEIEQLKAYNINDLDNTELNFEHLKPQLDLRYQMSAQYGVDLRSKSDAQIAEAVIVSEITKLTGQRVRYPKIDPETTYKYKVPHYISYETPIFQDALEVIRNATFRINEASGSIDLPEEIKNLKLTHGACTYRMGIGGLHSSEKTISYQASDDMLLIDRDVVSYYPNIILTLGLYPEHLGPVFLSVYRMLVLSRIADKKAGNKVGADSKKIVVNGSFGKLLSMFSALYAPDLGIQVTITGQLALLLLIEMIEAAGIAVISANTDGVLIYCPKARLDDLNAIVKQWEALTAFETEEATYSAVYSRDVNNYIAVKADGKTKLKGTYGAGLGPLWKNPENGICNDAVIALLTKGTPIEDTVRSCKDISRFLTVRNVSGGAVKSGVDLGRVVRWYFSTACVGIIEYAKNGNKVPNTDGARPLMELPDNLPTDIDFDRYVKMAESILVDIGHTKAPEKQTRFLF